MAMLHAQILNPRLDMPRTIDRLIQRKSGHQQHELFTTQAEGDTVFTERVIEHTAHGPQHRISGIMAICVIEAFEMIDVDHEARQRRAIARADRHRVFKCGVEPPPVGEAGQRIDHRHFSQRIAEAEVCQRQPDIFGQHLQIFLGPLDLIGCEAAGLFEIKETNGLTLRSQRDADGRSRTLPAQMFARNVDYVPRRPVRLAATQSPAA